jgi:hypothetical protein
MKFSEDTVNNLLTVLKGNGGNVSSACQACGISRKTFYAWKKENPDFADAVDEVTEMTVDNVESALYKNALDGNVTAQIFFLKTRGSSRGWVERFEHSGPGGGPIQTEEQKTWVIRRPALPANDATDGGAAAT